jgi:hypothetical protein
MTKETEKQKTPPLKSKLGPIPPEHFDDDLPCTGESDKSPGSLFDDLQQMHGKKPKPE